MTKENKETKSEVEIGEYKGSPTFIIHELDDEGKRKQYPFSFGKKKAKLILANLEDLKKFAEGC